MMTLQIRMTSSPVTSIVENPVLVNTDVTFNDVKAAQILPISLFFNTVCFKLLEYSKTSSFYLECESNLLINNL